MGGSSAAGGDSGDLVSLPLDSVDEQQAWWREQRDDLDFSPLGVILRLGRLRNHLTRELEPVFAAHGLTGPDFAVLVTLARMGGAGVSQRRIMDELGLTSGTVSVRIDRLVGLGLVEARPDPESKRTSLVMLTPAGRDLFERVVPAHLANEERLLAALVPASETTWKPGHPASPTILKGFLPFLPTIVFSRTLPLAWLLAAKRNFAAS